LVHVNVLVLGGGDQTGGLPERRRHV